MVVVKRIAHPGGFGLVALDWRIGERFLKGLDPQIVGAAVPAFAERRAAHADDRDTVLDTRCHVSGLHLRPLCGRAFPEIGPHAAAPVDRLDAQPHRKRIADLEAGGVCVGQFHQNPRAIVELDERSEEHTSELQSLMRISYAVFCLKKKNKQTLKKTNQKLNNKNKTNITIRDNIQNANY